MSRRPKDKVNKLRASAAMSKDMVENLRLAIEQGGSEAILELEIRDFGVWAYNRVTGARVFIGSMELDTRVIAKH